MRVTREILIKVAQDTIARKGRENRDLVAVYLCGSFQGEEYSLGGAADVDLVFVHADSIDIEREIIRLTDEVHLDIAHHSQRDYREARRLRLHPWLGPVLNSCKVMFDPQHFLDFTQASVRGQFDRADNIFERSRRQAEKARSIWLGYQTGVPKPGPGEMLTYLRAVAHAANAIASLSGPPITERRFLLNFPARAEAVGRPGLYPGLLGLLGAPHLPADALAELLPGWLAAFEGVSRDKAPARLHRDRRLYYQRAFEAIASGPQPEAVLWPLLHTWTIAASLLPESAPARAAWCRALEQLGLLGDAFAERVSALDAYLDLVDETLEEWARANGAWTA
jgi:hypothetical protein